MTDTAHISYHLIRHFPDERKVPYCLLRVEYIFLTLKGVFLVAATTLFISYFSNTFIDCVPIFSITTPFAIPASRLSHTSSSLAF